jgi:hypothetical protein
LRSPLTSTAFIYAEAMRMTWMRERCDRRIAPIEAGELPPA